VVEAGALERIVGTWGAPPDDAAWCALAVAALLGVMAFAPRKLHAFVLPELSRRAFLTLSAFAAASLSLAYVAFYLRGGPRIVDATSYWLQGRAIEEGHFAWSVPEPSASFRGRFLVFNEGGAAHEGESGRMAGIFPPGFPLLLSLGFLVGAPMVIGPALAAALVIATYALAREIVRDVTRDETHVEAAARLAALLSIACAALRYHTADTMAHGAAALGITLALTSALHARRVPSARARTFFFALGGLAVGYVAATRFASALPIACVVITLAASLPSVKGARHAGGGLRAVVATSLGILPGLALLAVAQRASLGDAFASTQRAYYALSDGPPGCFRYGFGSGVGCRVEHGDFVRAHLEQGYGLVAALGTTGRRLKMHLADIANFEPLALLVVVAIVCARRVRAVRSAAAVVLGQIAAYAPFYFDGNYPGGGARFYADVLPIEHALVALGVLVLAVRLDVVRKALGVLALATAGFAVHAAFGHEALANRDGGRPMFEPDVLAKAGFTHGLLFVDTDHAFNLAHDPDALLDRDATEHTIVARLRLDDHDRMLDRSLGMPEAYVYRFKNDTSYSSVADLTRPPRSIGVLEPFVSPPYNDGSWRFEAESDWPPLDQRGGWAEPIWATTTCASNGRALALHMTDTTGASTEARIALPTPPGRVAAHGGTEAFEAAEVGWRWRVVPRLLHGKSDRAGSLRLITAKGELARWEWPARPTSLESCLDLEPRDVTLASTDRASLIFALHPPSPGAPPPNAPIAYPALDRTILTLAP
jgi:hypothetical protein